MHFQANHVSASVAGDYYQVMFEVDEGSDDLSTPYLLIQREFEMPDDDSCYFETHDREYSGHFRIRRIELSSTKLFVEIDRPTNNILNVSFSIKPSDFKHIAGVMRVISGQTEPR